MERNASIGSAPSPSTSATITSWPTECFERGGRTFHHQLARRDDPHPVGEGVCFLQVLRREEDGHAKLTVQPPDLGPDRHPAVGVESCGGLVEEQDLGVVDQSGGEVETPLHSSRVGADAPIDGGTDIDQIEDVTESHSDLSGTQPVEAALQREQFTSCLPVVNRCILEGDANSQPNRFRILARRRTRPPTRSPQWA